MSATPAEVDFTQPDQMYGSLREVAAHMARRSRKEQGLAPRVASDRVYDRLASMAKE